LTQGKVLIIDDDPAVRNSLKFALEVEGFSVRAYQTGAELLKDSEIPLTDASSSTISCRR
jgi:two-component system, LuxR family, response regulator FixJ